MSNDQLEITDAAGYAEECLVGSIFLESTKGTDEAIRQVSAILQPSDFLGCTITDKPERWIRRARIFYAMTKCNLPPSTINVARKLSELNMLELLDCAYFAHCEYQVPSSLDYMHYAQAVKDYSIRRQIDYYAKTGDIQQLQKLIKPNYEDGIKL